MLVKIQSSSDEYQYLTTDLIEYQLETSHTDNDFAALKSYFISPDDHKDRSVAIGLQESWLNGMAELLKTSLKNWKKNLVPGRAVFYRPTVDPRTWKQRYVYVYQFRVRKSHDAAIARLAQQYGGIGETPDAQLRAAGIYHYRIAYMCAYEQPMVAMLFSVNSVIRERKVIELPDSFYDNAPNSLSDLPLSVREIDMGILDGAFGTVIVEDSNHVK